MPSVGVGVGGGVGDGGAHRLNDWNEKQETMRREKEDQRKRKIERALNEESEPKKKHFLGDPNYVSETAALVESVASAVDEGTLCF